jgi:hypothetical protein
VIGTYVDESRKYGEYASSMRARLQKRLEVLGPDNPIAIDAMRGADEKFSKLIPILKPLAAAHGDYGRCMLEMLDLLEKHRGSWTHENGELNIDDEQVRKQYNGIFKRFTEHQETVNRLAEEIRKTI